jgi:hypothetical protein
MARYCQRISQGCAGLSKAGLAKVWEERDEENFEAYYDLSDYQAQAVAESGGAMKIVAHNPTMIVFFCRSSDLSGPKRNIPITTM